MKREVLSSILCLCLMAFGLASLALRVSAADEMSAPAEASWQKLLAAETALRQAEPPSLEGKEFDAFVAKVMQGAGELADQFSKYRKDYTNSPHAAEACDKWLYMLHIAAQGTPARQAELEKAEQQCLQDPNLSRLSRGSIYMHQIERTGDLKQRVQLVRRVMDEFDNPTRFFCQQMHQIAAHAEYPHAREIVEEILSLKPESLERYRTNVSPDWRTAESYVTWLKDSLRQCQQNIRGLKEELDRIGRPLPLKFTALDGTPVDLERLRGKVVLLEFWATWCAPCVAGIPSIKAAWDTLHSEGFEVIALSYDTERATLEKFLKRNKLPWPQFFSPEGKEAPLIKAFGQPGPPAYWLIDQQGILVDINAHDNLEQKVKRLLRHKDSGTADPVSKK